MPRRYSQEYKDRAVRMVADRLKTHGSCTIWQAIRLVALKLGVSNETSRH